MCQVRFRGLSLPCKPVWGPPNHEDLNYNLPDFDPLWACIQDVDLLSHFTCLPAEILELLGGTGEL